MKTAKMIFAALTMAAFTLSCIREAELPDSLTGGIEMEFSAAWAEDGDSRTLIAENGADILWSINERINAFYGAQYSGVFTSTNTELSSLVTFHGTLDILTGSLEAENSQRCYWAIYPYNENNTCDGQSVTLSLPCNQIGSSGTFTDKFFPAVACCATPDLAFYNVCGGARFSVVTEGIKKVVFRSNDGSQMAGTVKVSLDNDGKPQILEISDAKDSVVVNAPEGGFVPGENYFAAMLPQTHAQGLTVKLYTANKKAAKSFDKSIIVRRSTFGRLDDVDEGLIYTECTDITPYEMVDLGLSVMWASYNLGASAPEEYGDYFAWGETEPKEDYSWSTYKWCMDGSATQLTKYCHNYRNSCFGYNGFTDNKTVLDPEDDAAAVNWGGKWRMPTLSECQELLDNCTTTWTTINGVNGRKLTSNKEGYTDNWIFLPAAGFRNGTSLKNAGSNGYYKGSSIFMQNPDSACNVYFASNYLQFAYVNRYSGQSIRPVYGEFIHVNNIMLDKEEVTLTWGASILLTATISPEDACEKRIVWLTSDADVATVEDGFVLGVSPGVTTITAISGDGGIMATCTVTVTEQVTEPDAVDLGLSVKWASFNLGATKPEEYGSYYGWGDIKPKGNNGWYTYKWCKGSESTLTKYCTKPSYGYKEFTDGMTVLEPDDDVAYVLLGGVWRMPTSDEFIELMTQCTWTWTTVNGVYGRKVTSKLEGYTNKWIFFPAAGWRDGTSLDLAGSEGHYWSSSIYPNLPYNAEDVYFDSGVIDYFDEPRYCGLSVRPVYDDFTHVTGVSLENIEVKHGESVQLKAVITPANATDQRLTWSSSDNSVASVNTDGFVTGIAGGTALITVTTVDGGFKAECTVAVTKVPVPEAVDLGLTVLWASFNIGASAPEEYGEYFAWGETEPKDTYSWNNYKFCMGSSSTLTKYCCKSNQGYNGFTDNKTILDTEDDAATVNLSERWRIPTLRECIELLNSCTTTWTTLNGVYGRKLTSNKEGYTDKWIFLPATGVRNGTSVNDMDSRGNYWALAIYPDLSFDADYMYFDSDKVGWSGKYRSDGLAIRPVCE